MWVGVKLIVEAAELLTGLSLTSANDPVQATRLWIIEVSPPLVSNDLLLARALYFLLDFRSRRFRNCSTVHSLVFALVCHITFGLLLALAFVGRLCLLFVNVVGKHHLFVDKLEVQAL